MSQKKNEITPGWENCAHFPGNSNKQTNDGAEFIENHSSFSL